MTGLNIDHGCYDGDQDTFERLLGVWALLTGAHTGYDPESLTEGDQLGDWPGGAPEDPLIILLAHNPSKGRIQWTHCPILADRLEEVEGLMLRTEGVNPGWYLATQQFIRGLRTAASYRQDVTFAQT